MSVYEHTINTLDGHPLDLRSFAGKVTLVVNVASQCGLTPQYAGLEQLQKEFGERGFTVLGVPCNQFGGQEPGTSEEIAEFCEAHYGVSFPLTEKIEVNGAGRHALYEQLTQSADAEGAAGDIQWNFEKFLVSGEGKVIARFRPRTEPTAEPIRSAITAALG
ncbi:glutathione peroxidase [Allorhizocola rhizosphaerae]|uniref:glutathione peroxidase n=1 Tax=Allorhizocola rhizosphaerae TaxID=1872709 RepID=UPI000E3ECDF2|nr:glutathione peroxidase [Allorhizocola rhizosphaerae]